MPKRWNQLWHGQLAEAKAREQERRRSGAEWWEESQIIAKIEHRIATGPTDEFRAEVRESLIAEAEAKIAGREPFDTGMKKVEKRLAEGQTFAQTG